MLPGKLYEPGNSCSSFWCCSNVRYSGQSPKPHSPHQTTLKYPIESYCPRTKPASMLVASDTFQNSIDFHRCHKHVAHAPIGSSLCLVMTRPRANRCFLQLRVSSPWCQRAVHRFPTTAHAPRMFTIPDKAGRRSQTRWQHPPGGRHNNCSFPACALPFLNLCCWNPKQQTRNPKQQTQESCGLFNPRRDVVALLLRTGQLGLEGGGLQHAVPRRLANAFQFLVPEAMIVFVVL